MKFLSALRTALMGHHPTQSTQIELRARLEAIKAKHLHCATTEARARPKKSPSERLTEIQARDGVASASPSPLHGFAQAVSLASTTGELFGHQDRVGVFDARESTPRQSLNRNVHSGRKAANEIASFRTINPVTGLPMMGNLDTAGNPYGASDTAGSFDSFPDFSMSDSHSFESINSFDSSTGIMNDSLNDSAFS